VVVPREAKEQPHQLEGRRQIELLVLLVHGHGHGRFHPGSVGWQRVGR
jgi:hypothetical protein